MNRKSIAIASLVGVIALTATYVFWPVETPEGGMHSDPAAQSAKLLDRVIGNTPFLADSIVDTRTVINGIKVPPVPDPKINNATIAGVDSDNNGVRDDIDRLVAEKFGDNPLRYQGVIELERNLQSVLLSPANRNAQIAYDNKLECMSSQVLEVTSKITRALLNTNERGRAYATAFAGKGRGVPCTKDRVVY